MHNFFLQQKEQIVHLGAEETEIRHKKIREIVSAVWVTLSVNGMTLTWMTSDMMQRAVITMTR